MATFTTVVHIATCVILVLVVLLQSGKGAEISTSLGGSSQTVFGSSGGANFFTRFTSVLAAIFMATSLYLTYTAGQSRKSLFEGTGAVPANSGVAASPAGASTTEPPNGATTSGAANAARTTEAANLKGADNSAASKQTAPAGKTDAPPAAAEKKQ